MWDLARGWLVVVLAGALVVVPAILFWILLWLAWCRKKEAKDTVRELLQNRFYVGKVQYRGEWRNAQHEPIIEHSCSSAASRSAVRGGARTG